MQSAKMKERAYGISLGKIRSVKGMVRLKIKEQDRDNISVLLIERVGTTQMKRSFRYSVKESN
jgi:hypothetical protein